MDYNQKHDLPEGFYTANNLTDLLDEHFVTNLGTEVKAQIQEDIDSRSQWLESNDQWMKLVTQVVETKTYPWPDASNIKFPLISTAAVQFHARSFPTLLGGNKPVKCRVIGSDKGNLKAERAQRLSTFLSFQITEGMSDWVGDMDRLLFILPIIGSLYKKTYYNEAKRDIVSELIHPRDLIINYDALEINTARKTHRQWKLPNTIVEYQNRGLYRKLEREEDGPIVDAPKQRSEAGDMAQGKNNPGTPNDFALQELYECNYLLDLDNDGYKEPYIITLRADTGEIYRIVANYGDKQIERGTDDSIVAIKAKNFYTHYFFLPDPESKTHGLGFGTMIGPINEAVNTLINILTDSGHMHSLGGGFLSRGVRLKGGAVKFRPNEWKTVNTTGDDLRKGIMPLPTKEPSMVLFQLLGMLIDSGKDLASVQDQMVGKSPGQNTPFSTTQSVLEQGMKVFNGIYKRVYRSMTKEFKKIYSLNKEFPDIVRYMTVLDMDGQDVKEAMAAKSPVTGKQQGLQGVMEFLANDFKAIDMDVIPTAEPDMVAQMEKIQNANSLLQKTAQGIPLNMIEVTRRILEAEGHENIDELMKSPPPQTPPDVQLEREKFEHQKQMDALKARSTQLLDMAKVIDLEMKAKLSAAQADQAKVAGLHAQFIEEQKEVRDEFDSVTKRLKVLIDGSNKQAAKPSAGDTGGNNTGGPQ